MEKREADEAQPMNMLHVLPPPTPPLKDRKATPLKAAGVRETNIALTSSRCSSAHTKQQKNVPNKNTFFVTN